MTKTRKFNGKKYVITNDFLRKHEAKILAETYREDGDLARITERTGRGMKGYYCVWVHKRPGYKLRKWREKKR